MCGEQRGACSLCPRLLLLPSRLTPVFLVQSPAPLGFNLLFIVLLDLDLGAPGLWEEVNTEMSPGLPLPSVLQTPRVGGHLDKFLSVKFGNLHVAQVDYKSTCSEPSLHSWERKPVALKFSHCQEIWLTSLSWSS